MITEYLAELGLDAAKEQIVEKLNENKLRASLTGYIERTRKYDEMVALAEEINFEGLVEYIQTDLISDVKIRIFDLSPKNRFVARQHIIDRACAHAGASTGEAKRRVSKCISICLDILRKFYRKGIKKKDYILAMETVDAIAEISENGKNEIVATIKKIEKNIIETSTNGSLFSISKAVDKAKNGAVDDIGDGITQVLKHTSAEHPLYPYYGYDYVHGRIVSVPLREDAKSIYPIRYKFTGALKFGGEYFNDPNGDPVEYAYRHQLPMVMEVSKAVKYIGDMVDPAQDDIEKMGELRADPPEFPPAFACTIKVGKQTYFEYILLRVREILDDGIMVINNQEQDSHIHFEVRINPTKPEKPDFKISISGASNKECLNYTKFMKALKEVKDIHIYVLEAGEDIIAGYINDFDLHTGFASIDDEIDFLERLCAIENYFHVVMKPEGTISEGEYHAVLTISDLVRSDEVKGTWEDATFTGTLDQHFREELLAMENKDHLISYVGTHHVKLFGAEFEFRVMKTFKCAHFDDIEKVKKKVEVLDDGDSIKITFKPGEDKTAIETLHIPEQMEQAS